MSYNIVKQALGKLTPEQQTFLKTRKYEGRQTMKQWLELFHGLAVLDTHGDKVRAKAKNIWIIALVFAIISLFIVAVFPFILILTIILLAVFIYYLTIFLKLNKIDLSNHLREQVYPFLAAIKDDLSEKEKIKMTLDFSDATDKKYLVQTIPNSSKRYPKITTYFYKLPYFSANFTLQDGAEVEFEADDLIRKRDITKRGSSGKIKSKVKYKIKHSYDLKIAFPKSRYQYLPGNPLVYNELQDYHELRLKTKNVSLTYGTIEPPEKLLMIFAAAYRSIKPI
jgi:hypothetical protein